MKHNELIGRMLGGRYQVAAFIHQLGMSSVYCCSQVDESTHVAARIFHPTLSSNPKLVERFLRRNQSVAELIHPNIIRTLGAGSEDGLLYIVTELVLGEDLLTPIRVGGGVPERDAARIVAEVCHALGYAHERGIIHGGLAPESVTVIRSRHDPLRSQVKVGGFGLAQVFDLVDDDALSSSDETNLRSGLTRVGKVVGSPAYMSPEQGRAEVIDWPHDLYSAGVLLFELLTGSQPFVGKTAMQTLGMHVNDPAPALSSLLPVHPDLEKIVAKALAKTPGERFASAKHMAQALEAIGSELSMLPRGERFRLTQTIALGSAAVATVPVIPAEPLEDGPTRQASNAVAPRPPRALSAPGRNSTLRHDPSTPPVDPAWPFQHLPAQKAEVSPPHLPAPKAEVVAPQIANTPVLPNRALTLPSPQESTADSAELARLKAAFQSLQRILALLLLIATVAVAGFAVAVVLLFRR
jgi:serine/threonine-protein kinase